MGGPCILACLVVVPETLVLVEGGTTGTEAVQPPGRAQQGGGNALDPLCPACLLPIFNAWHGRQGVRAREGGRRRKGKLQGTG